MLEDLALPDGVALARTTPEFSSETVPAGLLSAHRTAEDVWGRLAVLAGEVTFRLEDTGESRRLVAPAMQVIEPGVLHHVALSSDALFQVEFYR
jgi:tellurite resistance-related uncharacterized protein